MFYKKKRGQSILEYAILLGVIIAAVLIMQVFLKRHFQGGLKESAERMGGEMFSAGGTTIYRKSSLLEDQVVKEEKGTTDTINQFLTGETAVGTKDKGVYSFVERSGKTETDEQRKMDAAALEKFRGDEFDKAEVDDFTSGNLNF